MKLSTFAALAATTALTAAFALPADAAPKRKVSYIYYKSSVPSYWRGSPTRITVNRRSFLDPGTETKPYDEHYADYAFPPGGSWSPDRTNYNMSFDRMPLPNPFDIPGWPKY